MYDKRIKVCIICSSLVLLACILRLMHMQLLPGSSVQDEIAELKRQRGHSRQLKTLRGRILDRNGLVLAADEPRFQLCINYRLTSILDERVARTELLRSAARAQRAGSDAAFAEARSKLDARIADVNNIIDKCARFGTDREEIKARIDKINDGIWKLRTFLAWARNHPDPNIIASHNGKISEVPLSKALRDFENRFPSEEDRLALVARVSDIPEMDKSRPLLDLLTDSDVFTAQLEFMGADGIEILARGERYYYYATAACQTIGWVGPATQESDTELFADDRLASYLGGEVCGREDGVEYVCETLLRGRRGEDFYDIDQQLVSHTETRFGKDVTLTLDIELQKKIEQHLADPEANPNVGAPTAAVVMDVPSGEILALVSMPLFDLNRVRSDYDLLKNDPNRPLTNRAINKWYPPGSVTKPLILAAALQSARITPDEVIPCPALPAPKGWPNCLMFKRYHTGHINWPNNARNAIKGSCNIYFSNLADRIDPPILQKWLFRFGYGRKILSAHPEIHDTDLSRNFRQLAGVISSSVPNSEIADFSDLPTLQKGERRWFGIGQGNLRVTPLQVANAMAAIARKGIYKPPGLFRNDLETSDAYAVTLGLSPQTLAVLYDGMHAVVNEQGGTAYTTFRPFLNEFTRHTVKIHGKTGSTESPDCAWFGGFAQDASNRAIALAVVVEGGQSGSRDAAPLARDIIKYAIDAGYLGQTTPAAEESE
jgi:penicillin-binding protein 2